MLVTPDVMHRIHGKYGSIQDTFEEYMRKGFEQDDGEVVCELKMRRINFVAIPGKKLFKMKSVKFIYSPKSLPLKDFQMHLKNALNYYLLSVRKVKDVLIKGLRVWKLNDSSEEVIESYDLKHWNYTQSYVDAVLMVTDKPDLVMKLDDLNFVDEDIFLVETNKQDGSFCFKAKDNDDEE